MLTRLLFGLGQYPTEALRETSGTTIKRCMPTWWSITRKVWRMPWSAWKLGKQASECFRDCHGDGLLVWALPLQGLARLQSLTSPSTWEASAGDAGIDMRAFSVPSYCLSLRLQYLFGSAVNASCFSYALVPPSWQHKQNTAVDGSPSAVSAPFFSDDFSILPSQGANVIPSWQAFLQQMVQITCHVLYSHDQYMATVTCS